MVRQFEDAGFDEASARQRAALVATARDGLMRATGAPPAWAWFVPGRVEVFGKHTDYAGGRSLVGAMPRGFAIVAAPRSDGRVRVIDARWNEQVEIDPDDTATRFTGWRNYAAVVARRLAANFHGAEWGTDIAVASDLPRAAGLSSSSAFVVGLASALVRRAGIEARPDWRAVIGTPLDLAGYLGAVENGLTFKSLRGTSGVGTHGGSEDHTAILNCRANTLQAYAYVPVRAVGDAAFPSDWRFVIAASGVQADKAGSAKDRYNRASLATRALVEIWNDATGGSSPTLAGALATAPDARTRLRALAGQQDRDGFSSDALVRRLDHFVAEDARVPEALDAFVRADAGALSALADATQHEADTLLGNQIPETRVLAALAREHGAFAASSFGAGFGGSVWALVGEPDAADFARRWLEAYQQAMPAVGEVDWFLARPSPGVVQLRLT